MICVCIPSAIHGNIRADVFSNKVPRELHASEPGLPPDHDCSTVEFLERGLGDGGKLTKKKKVKRWWTGSKPSSENPTVGPARVSDADPLLSPPRHDFHRFLSERWPLRTTRTTNLRLRSQIHRFVAPYIVYSRIPRYFHPRNMSSASTRKRKADSNASPSSTSTKVQKSVYYHMFVNISC